MLFDSLGSFVHASGVACVAIHGSRPYIADSDGLMQPAQGCVVAVEHWDHHIRLATETTISNSLRQGQIFTTTIGLWESHIGNMELVEWLPAKPRVPDEDLSDSAKDSACRS